MASNTGASQLDCASTRAAGATGDKAAYHRASDASFAVPRRRISISAGTGTVSACVPRLQPESNHGSSSSSSSLSGTLRSEVDVRQLSQRRFCAQRWRSRSCRIGFDDLHGRAASQFGARAAGQIAERQSACRCHDRQRDHDTDDPRHRPGQPRLRNQLGCILPPRRSARALPTFSSRAGDGRRLLHRGSATSASRPAPSPGPRPRSSSSASAIVPPLRRGG